MNNESEFLSRLHDQEIQNQIENQKQVDDFREEIVKSILEPKYKEEIRYAMIWRIRWYKIWGWTGFLSKIIFYSSAIFAFIGSSDIIDQSNKSKFAFVAGTCTLISELMSKFSEYAKQKSKKKTSELNESLDSLGFKNSIPDITDNDDYEQKKRIEENKTKSNDNENKENIV
jgi:hypothetical protein